MPETFCEGVDTASAIKAILDSYPFGNGVLREILQNSDDAGASKQVFVLDNRTHATDTLLDPSLAECQGPALLCYNNSIFRETDWTALRTIYDSSKTADETMAGKYGLGFRSCYHITDNPHVLSGSFLAVLDPHNAFMPPRVGGQRINLLEEGSTYSDQLASFRPLANPDAYFAGTIIRLPLRTTEQAQRSRIKKKSFTPTDIQALFNEFVDKELSVAMLFLKHITSIELIEISVDGGIKQAGRVSIEGAEGIIEQRTFARGRAARFESFRCSIATPSGLQVWRIVHSVADGDETANIMSKRLGYDVGTRLGDDKLYSHVALAFPLNSTVTQGRLFTLLPLPIYSDFPLHVHAVLALTPDRQALRNREETGLSLDSRERLLVEWNQAIFDHFLPRAWARLLAILGHDDSIPDVWTAWPQMVAPSHSYWSTVPSQLALHVYEQNLPIFPTVSANEMENTIFMPLASTTLASQSESLDLLRAVTEAGLAVVQPEALIYSLLKSTPVPLFTPMRVQAALKKHVSQMKALGVTNKHLILDFLLAPHAVSSLSLICDLPIVPLANGSYVTLQKPSRHSSTYRLASKQEEDLFSECDENLISLQRIGEHTALFTDDEASLHINVSKLSAEDVHSYLRKKFGHFDHLKDEVSPTSSDFVALLSWLQEFWAWVETQKDISALSLAAKLRPFHLLPTATGNLRRVTSGILLPDALKEDELRVFNSTAVPVLHARISNQTGVKFMQIHGFGKDSSDIVFVLGNISIGSVLDFTTKEILQQYFLSRSNPLPHVPHRELLVLRSLPIYPILTPNGLGEASSVVAAINGRAIFIGDAGCPLPVLSEEATYVDVSPSQPARAMAGYIDESWLQTSMDEVQILTMAIPVLEKQHPANMDALIARMTSRWMDLSPHSIQDLCRQSFVLVDNGQRSRPSDVVDPKSRIAGLYRGEPGWFPVGKFGNEDLHILSPYFICDLTTSTIKERIHSVSSGSNTTKAELLLKLIDKRWSPSFQAAVQLHTRWIPTKDLKLRYASECRCSGGGKDELLSDLVLPAVSIAVTSRGLRSALGWDAPISLPTLISQLSRTLDLPLASHQSESHQRLLVLIKYIAAEMSLGELDVQHIREVLNDRPWIPSERGTIMFVHHAYFDSDVGVGRPFQHIHPELLGENERQLLLRLGCSERPALRTLVEELQYLAGAGTSLSVDKVLRLLTEISLHRILDYPVDARNEIMIPVSNNGQISLQPHYKVYYNDLGRRHPPHIPDRPFRVTTNVSPQLAELLGIPFASSLILGDDDDDDDGHDEDGLDMSEDLCVRINGVLKDYDIGYAFNEFLANAIDAGATKFSMCLDERAINDDTVLAPRLAKFNRGPAIVLYNDAVFTKDDFDGIRKVGQGAKSSRADTIGRFGLGALSLFHFTDLPMIVSGGSVLLLDPSGDLLPRRSGRQRTALLRPLSLIASKYEDQIRPLESMFGFSTTEAEFHGSLIRLPLRDTPSALSAKVLGAAGVYQMMNIQYYDLARSAMLFTEVLNISAEHRTASHTRNSDIWSIVRGATSEPIVSGPSSHHITSVESRKIDESHKTNTYLIGNLNCGIEEIPRQYGEVLYGQRLSKSRPGIRVGLASLISKSLGQLDERVEEGNSYLFSTLRLPVTTSLPIHISAQFALAPDRRSIRFDPPDIAGRRTLESAFNTWMLSTLVPRLYMYALQYMAPNSPTCSDNWRYWPILSTDLISQIVLEAFYKGLAACTLPICITPRGTYISPQDGRFSLNIGDPPADVRQVLEKLQCDNFVHPPQTIRRLCQEKNLSLADAPFVKSALEGRLNEFNALLGDSENPVKYAESVLEYLLEAKVAVTGFPLVLQSGTICEIPSSTPLFIFPGTATRLFSSNRFISQSYGDSATKLLAAEPSLNVHLLTGEWLVALVQEKLSHHTANRARLTDAEISWVMRFWEDLYKQCLPDPDSVAAFNSLPLIPTFSASEFVTLGLASEQGVLPPLGSDIGVQLSAVLDKLGIILLRESVIYGRWLNQERFSLCVLVKKLTAKGDLGLSTLQLTDRAALAEWIRGQLPLNNADLSTQNALRCLPVWPAWSFGAISLVAADNLAILPAFVTLAKVQRYLRPHLAVSEYSSALISLSNPHITHAKQNNAPLTIITPDNVLEYVQFPARLAESDIDDFRTFLRSLMLIGVNSGDILVPNGNLHLRPAKALYDQSIDLFSSSFSRADVRAQKFIHPSFHDLQLQLRSSGLRYEQSIAAGLDCATAIHHDLVHRLQEEQHLLDAARTFVQFYHHVLPSLAMSNPNVWKQFEDFRFIPRDNEQPQVGSLNLETYRKQLPSIVRPKDILLREHWAVCWSQRVACDETNLQDVIALNKQFGIPTVEDVVEHLSVLALSVSQSHAQNPHFLAHLTETYQWLQNHPEAQSLLNTWHSGKPLFLNVDNPNTDLWTWASADSLVFNLPYDGSGVLVVHQYLLQFSKLLEAVGAQTLSIPSFPKRPKMDLALETDSLRSRFNHFRKQRRFLDCVLEPTIPSTTQPVEDLHAHISFLSATIPHLENVFAADMRESQGVLNFQGSHFSAKAILEYIYTNDIICPEPATAEEVGELLQNILDLLDTAEAWAMPDLKTIVGELIDRHSLLTPETVNDILEKARTFKAEELVQHCELFRASNLPLLQRLRSS